MIQKALILLSVLSLNTFATPVVEIKRVVQNPPVNGLHGLVVITYDLSDPDNEVTTVELDISNGLQAVPVSSVSGDVGEGVDPGLSRVVTWDPNVDWSGEQGTLTFNVSASYYRESDGEYPLSCRSTGSFFGTKVIVSIYRNGSLINKSTYYGEEDNGMWDRYFSLGAASSGDEIRVIVWVGSVVALASDQVVYVDLSSKSGAGYYLRFSSSLAGDIIEDPSTYTGIIYDHTEVMNSDPYLDSIVASSSITVGNNGPGQVVVNRVESADVTAADPVVFVEGVSDIQLFTADVDWAGNVPGTIAFYKAFKSVAVDYRVVDFLQFSSSSTLLFNVGSLKAGEGVYVQAIAANQTSPIVWANFSVVSPTIENVIFESSVVRYGRHVKFLEGVSLNQTFTADVDWGGNAPGSINFYKGLRDVCIESEPDVLLQSGTDAEITVDVGTLLQWCGLYVQAVAANGVTSEKIWADFDIIQRPLGLSADQFNVFADGVGVKYLAPSFEQIVLDGGLDELSADGNSLPFFAGNPFSMTGGLDADFVVNDNGTGGAATIDLDGFGMKVGQLELLKKKSPGNPVERFLKNKKIGFEVSPTVSQEVAFNYVHGAWDYSGFISQGLAFDIALEIPLFHPVAEALLDVELGVTGSVKSKSNVVGLRGPGMLAYRGTYPVEVGGKALLFLGNDDLFGAGIWAKLLGTMELSFDEDPVFQKVGCRAAVGGKAVCGVFVYEDSWWDDSWTFYAADAAKSVSSALVKMAAQPAFETDPVFSLLPRRQTVSRSISTAKFMSSSAPVFPQTNVFQYVQTAFDASVSNACYLWNIDDSARSSENRTVLKYSVDNGSVWSEPATVWEDGTADYNPDVNILSDGTAYALWANGKSALPNGAELSDMLEGMEIAFAEYEPGSGWSCTNLTDNSVLDQSPKIAVANDGTAWAVWVRNDANNYQGCTNEPNQLMARYFDGAGWGEETVVASNLGMIASASLAQVGSNTVYTSSLHNDDNYFSMDDTEIYQAVYSGGTWGALTRLTENNVRDISVQLKTTDNGAPVAAWVQGDSLMLSHTSDFSSPQAVMSITNEPLAAYFDLLCGASNQIGMVWSSASPGGQDAFMINYDPVLSAWSQSIQLTDTDSAERLFDGNYDPVDGTLNLAFVQSEVLNPTNAAPEYGVTDVCLMDFNSGVDLRIVGFAYDSEQLVPGSNVVLSAEIDNAGLSGAPNVNLAFYDGDPAAAGLLIGQTNVAEFAAGLSVLFEQSWTVPLDGAAHQLYITADYAQALDDQNRGNNSQAINVLSSDLQMDSFAVFNTSNDVWRFDVLLANVGYCTYSNSVTLQFLYPDELGEPVGQTARDLVVESGSNCLVSVSFVDEGLFTNAYETLSAVLSCGSDTSVVDRVSAQFETSIDSDSDQISDADELRFGTDPNLLDSDGDGLDDYFELLQFESSAVSADTDGDGVTDYDEFIAGTASTNASSFFALRFENGLVRCPTVDRRSYTLETTGDLSAGWNVVTNFYGTGGWIDLSTGGETNQLFYRVKVWKPE